MKRWLSVPALWLLAGCHVLLELGSARDSRAPHGDAEGERGVIGDGRGDLRTTGEGAPLQPPCAGVLPEKLTKTIDGKTWRLVWCDEFNGPSLDPQKWTAKHEKPEGSEQQFYLPEEVLLEQGLLRLRASKRQFTDPVTGVVRGYTSGKVSTEGKVWFQHGRLEVGVRVAGGQGIQSKLELTSAKEWYPMGFDLLETRGDQPKSLHMTYRWDDSSSTGKVSDFRVTPDLTQDFHEVAAQWEAGFLGWYLDGQDIGFSASVAAVGAFNSHPMYFRFRTTVGGSWAGPVGPGTTFPQHLDLDYVRIYQRSDLPDPIGRALLNGSFEDTGHGLNGWLLPWDMKVDANLWASWTRDTSVFAQDGGKASFKIGVTAISKNNFDVQLSYRWLIFKAGRPYSLKFQARASVPRNFEAILEDDVSPWGPVCPSQTFAVTPEWQTFTLATCTPTKDHWPGAVRFNFGTDKADELGTVWLDAVTLQLP